MILHGQLCGNVGRRRIKIRKGRIEYSMRLFSFVLAFSFLSFCLAQFKSDRLFEVRDRFFRARWRVDEFIPKLFAITRKSLNENLERRKGTWKFFRRRHR
jgi:hypothetical protein